MIKTRFLKPFDNSLRVKVDLALSGLDPERCIRFLKSATDKQITEIGWGLLYIYPEEVRGQFGNKKSSEVDYSFIDDFRKVYSLRESFTSIDKSKGMKLTQLLKKHPNLTATEFLST
ncbi:MULTISPECIES: hypothetical protein [Streptococcus]|uniref:hypothetical protein n=1 Tax=Streptococcus TaxID=1301 RepID=UPI0028762D4A|nr:hypothetical protein [Streptococcus suis]MDS1161630.1 hypothetical protein [Streptococcus suis]